MDKKIFWLVGEKSGDLHASMVLQYCRMKHPDWQHYGVGGKRMTKQGFRSDFPFERFNVMGFVEVIKHLGFFSRIEKKIVAHLKQERPDLVILVDYPGLNMRIAKQAKAMGIMVLYYICPQFWAWKKHRIFQLREFSDAIGYILPFEGDYFKEFQIKASYTGHPISEEIEVELDREQFAKQEKLDIERDWIGFFPGSRDNEIKKLLPQYLRAIQKLADHDLQYLVSQSDSVSPQLFQQICEQYHIPDLKIIKGNNYEMMKYCRFLCVTSGTATLETAFLGTPFVICYRTSLISYILGRYLVKIKWIGLPNIILNKSIATELIQDEANPIRIAAVIRRFMDNDDQYATMQAELHHLHEILGSKSASAEVTSLMEGILDNG